jgi:hypothetical protein
LEEIPGLHKKFKNTASVRFALIQFVFFRFDLAYFWNKPSLHCFDFGIKRLRFASFFRICGINRLRFPSICPSCGINRVRSASFLRICRIKRLRFASICPICGINRFRSASIFRIYGINRLHFAAIFLRCRISRVPFASIFTTSGISRFVRFASISKTKSRSKLRSAFVSISLPLLLHWAQKSIVSAKSVAPDHKTDDIRQICKIKFRKFHFPLHMSTKGIFHSIWPFEFVSVFD